MTPKSWHGTIIESAINAAICADPDADEKMAAVGIIRITREKVLGACGYGNRTEGWVYEGGPKPSAKWLRRVRNLTVYVK
jgi:hypothetical protein